jgi:hypothetical protein
MFKRDAAFGAVKMFQMFKRDAALGEVNMFQMFKRDVGHIQKP